MSAELSRTAFLRGGFGRQKAPVRPPWAREASLFTDLCQRCDACLESCEAGIIVKGRGGFPEIDFRLGECSFCGRCVDACESGALTRKGAGNDGSPWAITAQIGQDCLAVQGVVCRLCEEQCEPRAIRFRLALGGYALPEVDGEACSGCGACVSHCPAEAIEVRAIEERADEKTAALQGVSA